MVALFVILTIILFLTVDYFVQRTEVRKALAGAAVRKPLLTEVLEPKIATVGLSYPIDRIPKGLFFDPGHTWLQLEPSGALRVGADMLPVTVLGGLEKIDLRAAGTEVRRGDPIVTLRRGERSLTLRAPVDGVIDEVNDEVRAEPSRLRLDPFGEGWLCKVTPKRLAASLRRTHVGEEALAWIKNEIGRVRDFMAPLAQQGALVGATLQDGGLPVEGLAEHLDEGTWTKFIDEFFAVRN